MRSYNRIYGRIELMPEKETDTVRKQSKKRKLLFTVLFVIINISAYIVSIAVCLCAEQKGIA